MIGQLVNPVVQLADLLDLLLGLFVVVTSISVAVFITLLALKHWRELFEYDKFLEERGIESERDFTLQDFRERKKLIASEKLRAARREARDEQRYKRAQIRAELGIESPKRYRSRRSYRARDRDSFARPVLKSRFKS